MDPAASARAQELFGAVARQEAALVQHEVLMNKHDGLLSDILVSLQEIFQRLPATPVGPPAQATQPASPNLGPASNPVT